MEIATNEQPLFLKPTEVAAHLRLSRAKVYDLIASGDIPSLRIAGSIRVPASALRDMEERARAAR